ncbi:alpha/beta hydrolase [Kovacikia minuta CCNUW1]|uniref:alpha/beta fold hydrolase n=1 Tax=Kovacikia minuta TaxID=2931930 RepID=UPI001CCE5E9D|nr:alpha/beta fold hydrolase [Kovacikia minuta]UBF26054.1 alpha/beta hydrolase [Kovacikia minuta CCNUW1]
MDGTGQLLRVQTAGLEMAFDVRCLAIPANDLNRWEILTAQVVALIETEIAKSPKRLVYLCGESFGGCLALKVALAAPHLFDRMILINPASSFSSRPWIAWGAQVGRWLPEPFFRLTSEALMPLLGNMEQISADDRQAFWQAVQSVPQETTLWRLSLLSEFTFSNAQLRQLNQPTLLLASARDRLLPSLDEVLRLVKQIPKAKMVVLPNSGHACLLESDVNLYEILKQQGFC